MGFLSQQITAPNFDHYAYPQRAQIQTAQYEGQVQAYQQYMNSLWTQWGDYARVVSQTTKGLQDSFASTFGDDGAYKKFDTSSYQKAIDSAFDAQRKNYDKSLADLNRSYKDQTEKLEEETVGRKKTASANLGFRGLGNTTTRGQVTREIQGRSDEIRADYDEAYSSQKQGLAAQWDNIVAQRKEWQSDLSRQEQAWNTQRALAKDQASSELLGLTSGMQQNLLGMQPLQLDPGAQMQGDYLSNLVNQAQAAQNPDVVTGEEGGWGGLALTGLGAGIGALFGPAGMMMGAGLGGALGGGLEMGFGAPSGQQQGAQSMMSGLMSAGMAGLNSNAQWSWGSPSNLGAGASAGQWGGTPYLPGHGPSGYQNPQSYAGWLGYNADPYVTGQYAGPPNPYAY